MRMRSSTALPIAEKRFSGLTSIDDKFDLGDGIDVKTFQTKIGSIRATQEEYNRLVARLGEVGNLFDKLERDMRDYIERGKSKVAGRWGTDSSQYEALGFRRKSERRRSPRKTNVA